MDTSLAVRTHAQGLLKKGVSCHEKLQAALAVSTCRSQSHGHLQKKKKKSVLNLPALQNVKEN